MPATLQKSTDNVLDNPAFIVTTPPLVKLEHHRLTTKQARIDTHCRQFVELGAKSAGTMPVWKTEPDKEQPANIVIGRGHRGQISAVSTTKYVHNYEAIFKK